MCFGQWLSIIQTSALIITLGVLLKYTVETTRLRKTTVKQTELQLRPCVVICYSDIRGIERYRLKNVGHSPALNISINDIENDDVKNVFTDFGILEPNEDEYMELIKVGKDDPKGTTYSRQNQLGGMGYEEVLTIKYRNIENKQYFSKVKIFTTKDKVEFLETGEG